MLQVFFFFVFLQVFFFASVVQRSQAVDPCCSMAEHPMSPLACPGHGNQPGPAGSTRSSISRDSDPFSRRSKGRQVWEI